LRHKVTIATKVGLTWKDGAAYRDSRAARIRKEIEDSLRRLRTDVIDLYQILRFFQIRPIWWQKVAK
jgi:aryl-alcohol dehydrogenase-like predicted oxidoreductase